MIDTYFYWSGVFFNLIISLSIILAIWSWLIFPAVEAASIARYYRVMGKVHGIKMHSWFRLFLGGYELFGRTFESQRCSYGFWEGGREMGGISTRDK